MKRATATNQPKAKRARQSGAETDSSKRIDSSIPLENETTSQPDLAGDSNAAQYAVDRRTGRSPDLQVEFERIGKLEPFICTQRDLELEKQLNDWRDLRSRARLVTTDPLGLAQSLDFYTKKNVKRRADLLLIPAPVVKIRIEQPAKATGLFRLILSFLNHPIDFGTLWQLRSRTKGTLKTYQVKILIVESAHLLSIEALREIINISLDLSIAIVLAGSPSLNALLDPKSHAKRKNDYVEVHNAFLEYGEFSPLSISSLTAVVQSWEEKGVGLSKSLHLWEDTGIIALLNESTGGQVRLLYECLRQIYVWKIDHPQAQINYKNVEGILLKRLAAANL